MHRISKRELTLVRGRFQIPQRELKMKPIKIIVVGDSVVGKTQLLNAYVFKENTDEYIPRV